MKRTLYICSTLSCLMMLAACDSQEEDALQEKHTLTITSSISAFEGDDATRANVAGNAFEPNDMIRLKIICPFAPDWQQGEHTWSGTHDSFWLLKWNNEAWATLKDTDGYDISGSFSNSNSSDIFSVYESQATPYVYTASTWTEEKLVKVSEDNLRNYYSSVFHADQSREKNYKASDILWAQQYSQTGTWNIHLNFNHVMSALLITIDDSALPTAEKITANAVLTLEKMPAIDQAEIIIGDYYAAKDENNYLYGYRQKYTCDYANNGKVIGAVSLKNEVHPFTGGVTDSHVTHSVIANTATYTCYEASLKTYRVIVPPCTLSTNADLWLRNDTKRYKMTLERTQFEQGKLYQVVMKLKSASAPETGGEDSGEGSGGNSGGDGGSEGGNGE